MTCLIRVLTYDFDLSVWSFPRLECNLQQIRERLNLLDRHPAESKLRCMLGQPHRRVILDLQGELPFIIDWINRTLSWWDGEGLCGLPLIEFLNEDGNNVQEIIVVVQQVENLGALMVVALDFDTDGTIFANMGCEVHLLRRLVDQQCTRLNQKIRDSLLQFARVRTEFVEAIVATALFQNAAGPG